MNIDFAKSFNKQFEKLTNKRQKQIRFTIALFLEDTKSPSLRIHKLKGDWSDHHSISSGGDLRIHYKQTSKDTVLFIAVGTHSQLYK